MEWFLMHRLTAIMAAAIMLAGCGQKSETLADRQQGASLEQARPVPPAIPIEPATPLTPPIDPPPPKVTGSEDLKSCPGMDIKRPAGTNCFGILPSACGADKIKKYVGRIAVPPLRAEVATLVSQRDIRWIRPGEPVVENLDPERLNIELDTKGAIARVDCY
jgi:hypothetical protein